ncbi:MAG: PaaI family thioesterase [Polyangiales bacterium]
MAEGDQNKLKQKLRAFAEDFPFFKLLGVELVDFGPEWSTTRIALAPELRNANGVMHGGVLATLIDIGFTQAMLMTDAYQQVRDTKGSMSSLDLRVKYLRPLTDGYATCEARISHLGRRVAHASAVVKNDQGKEVALGDAMLMITLGEGTKTPSR